ncbi:integrase [Gammaproteobacteria bacterium 2W06]|nr:integrase [Gammaproteobacteria bacterium 2W06]
MPKLATELSAMAIRKLQKPGLHAVGGVAGLYIRVTPTGAKYWFLRAMVNGRRRDVGLGPFPEVSLAMARQQAAEIRAAIRDGHDPLAERRAQQAERDADASKRVTFDDCLEAYWQQKIREFKNPKHAKQWRTSVETYISPSIGGLTVDQIELAHIVSALRTIWESKPETASRVRGRTEKVLDFAFVSGYRQGPNPARWKGNLDAVLPATTKIKPVQHHAAIPWPDAPAFLRALRQCKGIAPQALTFLLLTAARSGEVRGATWDEIDLGTAIWTIPAERMKAGKPHLVPLSDQALALLRSVPQFPDSPYIFPAPRGGMLSDMALSKVMKRMNVKATPHGLRSTFRDWISENTNYPHEVAEQALAHVIPNAVERAYRRSDLLEKRRNLMADWATFLDR